MCSHGTIPTALCSQNFIGIEELQELRMIVAQLPAEFRVPLIFFILKAMLLLLFQIWRTGSKRCLASLGNLGVPVLQMAQEGILSLLHLAGEELLPFVPCKAGQLPKQDERGVSQAVVLLRDPKSRREQPSSAGSSPALFGAICKALSLIPTFIGSKSMPMPSCLPTPTPSTAESGPCRH